MCFLATTDFGEKPFINSLLIHLTKITKKSYLKTLTRYNRKQTDFTGEITMELGLSTKVAVITGGTKGIGLYTARQLLLEGARVAICGRSETSLKEANVFLKEQTGTEALAIVADVTKKDQCENFIAKTVEAYGHIDILVNNAGSTAAYSFEDVDAELWQHDLDIKLFAAIHCSKAALPYLKENGGQL